VDRPPAGGDWVYEIKFDGYRIQMRVENGAVSLKTRKGLDWTAKFGSAISRAASKLPDCLIDGEVVALDHRGSPDFAGLQAALSESKTDDLIFFAFDLLFLEDEDLATRFSSPPAECPWKASYPSRRMLLTRRGAAIPGLKPNAVPDTRWSSVHGTATEAGLGR
jgi:hypothetical protein